MPNAFVFIICTSQLQYQRVRIYIIKMIYRRVQGKHNNTVWSLMKRILWEKAWRPMRELVPMSTTGKGLEVKLEWNLSSPRGREHSMETFDFGDGRGAQRWGCGRWPRFANNHFQVHASTHLPTFQNFLPKYNQLKVQTKEGSGAFSQAAAQQLTWLTLGLWHLHTVF